MAANSHVGDIGVELIATFKSCDCNGNEIDRDISTATEVRLCILKPDQTTLIDRVAAFTAAPCGAGDGTDGKASIFTIAGDFDQAGTYCIGGKVTFPGGSVFRATEQKFRVDASICP